MRYETSVVYLEQLPKVVIDSGTDWVTLGGFISTVIVFVLGTIVTVYSFRKTVKSQEQIATSNSLKASRQAWINDLRDSLAAFVASAITVEELRQEMGVWLVQKRILASNEREMFLRENPEWSHSFDTAIGGVRRLKAKIELLLNPTEPDSEKLLGLADQIVERCNSRHCDLGALCVEIVQVCQVILKSEWERVKVGV